MKKLLLIVLILFACEEEPTASNSESYSFNLSVVDQEGTPLANTDFKVRYIYIQQQDESEGLSLNFPIQDSNSNIVLSSINLDDGSTDLEDLEDSIGCVG